MVSPSSFLGFELDATLRCLPAAVHVYLVGGAVRDRLMGRPSHDQDWVVVGATVADMLQAGFKPVGADFPVFLHPETQEEYALARTERKSGHGYKGFCFYAEPSVRLEDDLARRDFTINAMALDSEGGLIDPYGGQHDLEQQVFRHVSPAFVEDPLRVLRLAHFLARFHDFHVHSNTLVLCQQLRDSGELSHLVSERVFSELNRGLGEAHPSRMLEFLMQLNIWSALLPEADLPFAVLTSEQIQRFDHLSGVQARWAYGLGCLLSLRQIESFVHALKVPNEVSQLARVVAQVFAWLQGSQRSVDEWARVLAAVDVYRKPERLHQALSVLLQVVREHEDLSVFQRAVVDQMSGHYKQALRVYLAARGEEKNMAEQVLNFKRTWVCQLLSQGNCIKKNNIKIV